MNVNSKTFARLVLLAGASLLPATHATAQGCDDPPHWLILLDRSGSMSDLRQSPATGNTRWVDAVAQAIADISTQDPVDDRTLYSVWSFEGSNVTMHSAFDDFAPTLFALIAISSSPLGGCTPLAEAMCTTIDELLAAAGPGGDLRCRVLLVYSDGEDNCSSGPCSGPASLSGTTCTSFILGSWQRNVCDKLTGNAVGLFRYFNELFLGAPPISTTLCAFSQTSNGAYTFIADDDPNYPGVNAGDCVTDWILSGGASGACACPGTSGPGTPVCFGDGSGAPCGCGNESNPGDGSGCLNSLGVGGVLAATGTPNTLPGMDTVVLTASGVPSQPGLFLQANNTIGGGTGGTFGDGIRCCGQNVVRLQIVIPAPPQPSSVNSTVTITNTGPADTVLPGDKKCYQYWYRDPGAANPCGNYFNFTNALSITWF